METLVSEVIIIEAPKVATVEVEDVNPSAVAYTHIQSVASATWTVVHNLGWYPNVVVQDSSGTTVEGDITYDSRVKLTLTFSGAFSGRAYLS